MTDTKQKNYRLPPATLKQLEALTAKSGMTEVQLIIVAIDRMSQQELQSSEPKPR